MLNVIFEIAFELFRLLSNLIFQVLSIKSVIYIFAYVCARSVIMQPQL